MKTWSPTVLIILDGWGIAPKGPGNAIAHANTTHMDSLAKTFLSGELEASGEYVGLPRGEDGNSEVGHLNLGAGRIVYQDLPRINMAIADGSFLKNDAINAAIKHAKRRKSTLHLLGLVGAGNVHSSMEHVLALLWFAKMHGRKGTDVKVHMFTDGRDAPPTSALAYAAQLAKKLEDIGVGQIASVCGRYFAMDRNNHWQRTARAYRMLIGQEGSKAKSAHEAIESAYQQGLTDEFIVPTLIVDDNGKPVGPIRPHDAVIFFNFRADRARQLTKAFVMPNFGTIKVQHEVTEEGYLVPGDKAILRKTFHRGPLLRDLFFVTLTEHERGLPVSGIAFPPVDVQMPLAEVISNKGLKQLHIAETEKYPHVTYFFNGGREKAFPHEERILIPSPRVPTYDKKPEMSAEKITTTLLKHLTRKKIDFAVVNFANPDMVGHTGIMSAAVKAVEATDRAVGLIVEELVKLQGCIIITADHGNVEEMIEQKTGDIDTKHSTNRVPLIIVNEGMRKRHLRNGVLGDVAPTILSLMHLPIPKEMTGKDLLA